MININYLRVYLVISLILYSPLFTTIFFNVVPPSSTLEIPLFLQEAAVVFIVLFLLSLFFFGVLRIIPRIFAPYYIAIFIFSYILFLSGLVFNAVHSAPNLNGLVQNLSVIPNFFLIKILLIISILTITFMFFMKINIKTLAIILLVSMVSSSCFVVVKEIMHANQINKFFGDCRKGKIVFEAETFLSADKLNETIIFSLMDRNFKKSPLRRFSQGKISSGQLKELTNPKFIVYDYSYDRDDLNKIIVENVENGETILLAAGFNPVWIK